MPTAFNPNTLIIESAYYILVGIFSVLSIFAVYILLHYGKNRLLNLFICLFYAMFYLQILAQSYQTLKGIL
jgi:hypothetical protein